MQVTELQRLVTMGAAVSALPGSNPAAAPGAASSLPGGVEGAGEGPEGQAALGAQGEAALGAALQSLLDPRSTAFRSVSNALAAALTVHLVAGAGGVAATESGVPGVVARSVAVLLARVGAAPLGAEVRALASRLAEVCAVSESVFEPLYMQLAS